MLHQYDLGFDPGNSETSVVVIGAHGEQKTLTSPSQISRGSYETVLRNLDTARQARNAVRFLLPPK